MYGVTIHPTSPMFATAEQLELQIFGEANDWATLADHDAGRMVVYDEFRPRSRLVIVVDEDGEDGGDPRPLAITRLVHGVVGDLLSFPTGRDYHQTHGLFARGNSLLSPAWCEEVTARQTSTVELATQARVRGTPASAVLAGWITWFGPLRREGVTHLPMAIVPPLLRRYQRLFGPALRSVGETLTYVGTDSIPAELDLTAPEVDRYRHTAEQRMRVDHPEFRPIDEAELTDRFGPAALDRLVDHPHTSRRLRHAR